MGYIYKITNTINGKVYVGQTRQDIPTRWKQHITQSSDGYHGKKTHFMYAIRKYGADAFIVEELEKCDDSILDDREIYWIDYYKANINGYNIAIGGSGGAKYSDEEILSYWEKGLSLSEITKHIDLHPETISKHLKRCGITTEEIKSRAIKAMDRKQSKPIYQYGMDGTFIKGFKTTTEATKEYGKRIRPTPTARQNTICGYQWKAYKVDKIEPTTPSLYGTINRTKYLKRQRLKQKVVQFDLDGNFLCVYESAIEPAKAFDLNPSGISGACRGRLRRCGEFQWRYLEDAKALGMKLEPYGTPIE